MYEGEPSAGGALGDSSEESTIFDESLIQTWDYWILLDEHSEIDAIGSLRVITQSEVGQSQLAGEESWSDEAAAALPKPDPVVFFRDPNDIESMSIASQLNIRSQKISTSYGNAFRSGGPGNEMNPLRKNCDPDVEYGPEMLYGEG